MRILIFTEGGSEAGYGHLIRCSALAESFSERGFSVEMYIAEAGHLKQMDFPVPIHIFPWYNSSDAITESDVVIIDSYKADPSWLLIASQRAALCLFFDDYCRLNYPPGIIINAAFSADDKRYSGYKDVFAGPDYQILRKPFRTVGQRLKTKAEISSVLISLGGGEHSGLKEEVAGIISECCPKAGITVIGNPKMDAIFSNIVYLPWVEANELSALLINSDIIVTNGGQTLAEAAACGIPAIVIQTAENQIQNIAGFINEGAALFAGQSNSFRDGLHIALERFRSAELRISCSMAASRMIDGKGNDRVISGLLRKLLENHFTLRYAIPDDVKSVYDLSNDPAVRSVSFSQEKIEWENHVSWFNRKIDSPDSLFLISELLGEFAGQIRFDKLPHELVLSISVCSAFRGSGIGQKMVEAAVIYVKKKFPEAISIHAYVQKGNEPSKRIFLANGYSEIEQPEGNPHLFEYLL